MDIVRLSVLGALQYRDVVVRVVASVCRWERSGVHQEQEADHRRPVADFDDKVVSVVGEAFDNIALHGYSGSCRGNADLELEFHRDLLTIRLLDTGKGFDPSAELLKLTKRYLRATTPRDLKTSREAVCHWQARQPHERRARTR